MLKQLAIDNYAIIDHLQIDFPHKMSAITGETGAGKSIIMGALGLILGERADSTVLVSKDRKCIVEGVFAPGRRKEVMDYLRVHDLDMEEELVIRREINTSGKSRAFVNDTPVTLAQLQQLSTFLVDLHQQFDTLEIGNSRFQMEVMDALASQGDLLAQYARVFAELRSLEKEYRELQRQKLQFDREADYNRFQFNELEEAGFKERELEDLEAELKMLSHAGSITNALNKVVYELKESESPVIQQLKMLQNQLSSIESYHPGLSSLVHRLQAALIEIKDIAGETENINSHIQHDPARIEQLNERLSLGYKLLKKHGVQVTADLLRIREELHEKLQAVLNMDSQLKEEEQRIAALLKEARELADQISAGRAKQVLPLEKKVNQRLRQVGMPNARLKVAIGRLDELDAFGIDSIQFLFNANIPQGEEAKHHVFQPLRKVASGGELSRVMLCIKSLVAQSMDLPTMIFDEIDTGISGEAARQVALIMKELAAKRQVICITHQPQIAGKADAHFLVYKEIVKDAVKTSIRRLSDEERVTAIAKMLGGEQPTAAAMENAREMVGI